MKAGLKTAVRAEVAARVTARVTARVKVEAVAAAKLSQESIRCPPYNSGSGQHRLSFRADADGVARLAGDGRLICG